MKAPVKPFPLQMKLLLERFSFLIPHQLSSRSRPGQLFGTFQLA